MSHSAVIDTSHLPGMECRVAGRMILPQATVELHHYRFTRPQNVMFRSGRAFLDLALSRRAGAPSATSEAWPDSGSIPMGDIIFIPAGQDLQTTWGAGEQRSLCCGIDALAGDDADLIADSALLEAALDVRSPQVHQALARLAHEIESPGFGSAMLAEALMTQAGVELYRYFRGRARDPGAAARLGPGQLRRIDEAIEQPGKLPGVAVLARLCDVSTRHFFRLFKVSTGQTLAAYAADRRVARAKALLAQRYPPIKEIAWRCGFETPAAFSAAFRKQAGMTPKAFRQTTLR